MSTTCHGLKFSGREEKLGCFFVDAIFCETSGIVVSASVESSAFSEKKRKTRTCGHVRDGLRKRKEGGRFDFFGFPEAASTITAIPANKD